MKKILTQKSKKNHDGVDCRRSRVEKLSREVVTLFHVEFDVLNKIVFRMSFNDDVIMTNLKSDNRRK